MAKLETAVQDMAVALEELSAQAERHILNAADDREALARTRDRAGNARRHAKAVSRSLAQLTDDVRRLRDRIDAPAQSN